jgi:hypothetical protein
VRDGSVIHRSWRWIKHQWRAWRNRQRRAHVALALVALLSLGVVEPLICIIHCQFWLPFALQTYFAAQHQHHHTPLASVADAPSTTHPSGAALVLAAPPVGCPVYQGNSSGAPIPPPPSLVHEVVLPLMLLALVVLLVAAPLTPPLTGPPRVFIPVTLRPPIPIAG